MDLLGPLLAARRRRQGGRGDADQQRGADNLGGMTVTESATRVLDNYIGGSWTPAGSSGAARRHQPGHRRGARPRAALERGRPRRRRARGARGAAGLARRVGDRARPARCSRSARGSTRAARSWPARSRPRWARRSPDARAEVARMIEMVEAACAIPTTMQGRILEDVSRGIDAETIRQPVGVCAAIVPFNFPAMVPFWFLPFAIGCGNTFILKPSEQVPLTQQIAFEVLDSLGLPPGVVNLVNGGREVVEGILDHPGIDAISFVGSAPVARDRLRARGQGRQARAGARRREEPHGRDAGRGDRQDRQRHHRLRLRRRRPALHGGLRGRDRRRGARAAAARAEGGDRGGARGRRARRAERARAGGLRGRARAHPRRRRARASARAPSCSSTGATPASPEGCFIGATILDGVTPEMELAREEIFGPGALA